jgi:hypothetical protein
MTRQEKNLCKRVAKNLTICTTVTSALGVIFMLIGITLILNSTAGNTTGNEILVFGVGALVLVISMLLATRTHIKYVVPLNIYRNDLLLKKDKHYYNRVCFYAKDNEIDRALFYFNLLKNRILRDISFGFILGRIYDKKDPKEYNDLIDKYNDIITLK